MTRSIVWFRQDLRLADHPALLTAVESSSEVLPLYIHDPAVSDKAWPMGSAAKWWLHHALVALDENLQKLGSRLEIRVGSPEKILIDLVQSAQIDAVYWNRRYGPEDRAVDQAIKDKLKQLGVTVKSFNGSLLREPWEVVKGDGEPYRVFTPFWKALERQGLDLPAEPAPSSLPAWKHDGQGVSVDALNLLPKIPWDQGFKDTWAVSESAAHELLESFVSGPIAAYSDHRNLPDRQGTSRLSPYLLFGQISPRQVVQAVRGASPWGLGEGATTFLKEIGWREFAHHLLFHFPKTTDHPLDLRFERFPWLQDPKMLKAWQQGQTGIPIVDAGMRELWHTGWMHNRVRMIVASFLTKNLRHHWLEGARWFFDTLVDADLANNTLGWQWTAGCGADAAPFFRIFNPVLQGEKFDPEGRYVRRWVPELSKVPNAYLHHPWDLPLQHEAKAEITAHYPQPLVDLSLSRLQALEAFKSIK